MKQVAAWNSSAFVAPTYLSLYGSTDLISNGCFMTVWNFGLQARRVYFMELQLQYTYRHPLYLYLAFSLAVVCSSLLTMEFLRIDGR
jgi:hypothetical protein